VFLEAHGENGAAPQKRRIGLAAAPILYDAPDDCPAARLAHLIELRRIATVAGVRRASETLSFFSPGSKIHPCERRHVTHRFDFVALPLVADCRSRLRPVGVVIHTIVTNRNRFRRNGKIRIVSVAIRRPAQR
jgi:hypothetical protein